MHVDSLELGKKMVDGKFLPKKYFNLTGVSRSIQSLAYIPNDKQSIIFAGTDHGLFRTIDSGKSWVESKKGLFNQDIRALAVDPKDSRLIYAGTPKGIFKSWDSGESWTDWYDQASGLTNAFINDLLIDPNQAETIYAATQGGLFVSHEGGDFWESIDNEILKNESIQSIQFSASHPEQLIIHSKINIFRSTDDKKLWEKKWTDIPKNITSIITIKTDPEFIFIGTEKGFYKSFNGGLNWLKDKNRNLKRIFSLARNTEDNTGIFLSSNKGLFYSVNSGDTWLEITPNKSNLEGEGRIEITKVNKILATTASKTQASLLLVGSETGLFISNNNGALWRFINLGNSSNTLSTEDFRMDLTKLVTEIHTGRFFGTYFYWVVDIATIGMIGLAISGLMIILYRKKIKKTNFSRNRSLDQKRAVYQTTDMAKSIDNEDIYDRANHINTHLKKFKTIYKSSKTKEESRKIEEHISTLDTQIQLIVKEINDFSAMSQNASLNQTFPEKKSHPYNQIKNLNK